MRIARKQSLSTVTTSAGHTARRPSPQTLQALEFIHRFRRIHTRHLQHALGHTNITTTRKQLTHLRALGYIDRRYGPNDRAINRAASYYVTLEGLATLKAHNPARTYRNAQSIRADATLSLTSCERYHTLADVYVHFKRFHAGQLEFFTSFDIAKQSGIPDEVPDGYLRLSKPGSATLYYFVEIYGWNRSTYLQQRRLYSYIGFAENEPSPNEPGSVTPGLFAVAASEASQKRLSYNLAHILHNSLADNYPIYTTSRSKLESENPAIWQRILSDQTTTK